MADVKKAKAPAAPRKSRKKQEEITVATFQPAPVPTHEQISALARRYWEERGWRDGHAEQDWLRAEQELNAKAS